MASGGVKGRALRRAFVQVRGQAGAGTYCMKVEDRLARHDPQSSTAWSQEEHYQPRRNLSIMYSIR